MAVDDGEQGAPPAWELYGGGIVRGPQSKALWRRLGLFWLLATVFLLAVFTVVPLVL